MCTLLHPGSNATASAIAITVDCHHVLFPPNHTNSRAHTHAHKPSIPPAACQSTTHGLCALKHRRTRTHAQMHRQAHTHTCTRRHARACKHVHAHARACTYARMHMHANGRPLRPARAPALGLTAVTSLSLGLPETSHKHITQTHRTHTSHRHITQTHHTDTPHRHITHTHHTDRSHRHIALTHHTDTSH